MRTFYMTFLLLITLVLLSSTVAAVTEHTERVQLDSRLKTIHYIAFHPTDGYALKPVTADNKIGRTTELATMAKQHEAVAAINGTFFNAYDPEDLQPMGAIMIDRKLQHVRGGPVAMGITTNGALTFQSNLYIPITICIEKSDGSTRTWSSSFINHLPASNDERNIFTPAFRSSHIQLPGYEFVIVRQGIVSSIVQDEANIPADGYVISFDPNRWSRGDTFNVGDTVTYEGKLPDSLHRATHMISVGPKLVSEGKADVNFERDRMTDPNMTQYAAQRSFVGHKADGTIVMGTAANVTMYDLADLLVAIGIHEAMNLDGGASSGLYHNGKYITRPGRNLSNALVVVKQPLVPSIWLNEHEILFDDAAPFIQNGTTLVPVRGVFEELGATLDWDGATETVTAKRFDAEIQLTVGKKEALVNEEVKELLVAPVNVNGRVHIPLRFVSEALGAEVDWDAGTWTISIESDILTAEYHDEQGVQLLEQRQPDLALEQLRLAMNLNLYNEEAWIQLANLYKSQQNFNGAVEAYKQITNSSILNELAWAAHSAKQWDTAIEAFTLALDIEELKIEAHYGLGVIYREPPTENLELSDYHLNQVILIDPDSSTARQAQYLLQ